MLSYHLFNYQQTKAHRNIWGTDAEALPASFRGYKQSKQDGGVGNTDTGGRSPEMRRGGLVSAPPLVLCYSPAQEQRQRRCSSIIQTGWLSPNPYCSPLTAASSEPCWTLRGTASAACCGVYRHRVYRKEWNTDGALGTSMNRI